MGWGCAQHHSKSLTDQSISGPPALDSGLVGSDHGLGGIFSWGVSGALVPRRVLCAMENCRSMYGP